MVQATGRGGLPAGWEGWPGRGKVEELYKMDSKEKGRQEESLPVPTELIQVDPSELRFPFLQNAVLIGMPRCTSATESESELISSGCFSLVLYISGAANVRCSRCNMVNSTTTASQLAHLTCGQCRTTLMYPAGAMMVGCATCQHLNPVRGQGSSTPPTSSSVPEELIQVDPSELSFPFLPNEMLSASFTIKLVNVTDSYVIFLPIRMANNVAEYITRPYGGILPPRSTQEFVVRRVANKSVAQSIECDDKYLVYSTPMSKNFSNFEYASDLNKLYEKQGGQIWHKRELGVVLYQAYQQGSPHGKPHAEIESTLDRMTLQHLKDITNNFCNERILGIGGSGVVYKGVLGNGKMVAVKKLVQSMSSSQEQFENEVNLLMRLNHPNIVRLVGYCYETKHSHSHHEGKFVFTWDTECLLCLEFLLKGSLDKYISDASSGFDWPTRLKIIEGISYGLQYLHEQSDGPIIHLDLKPANILLEENMIPKVTDFGLSRLLDQKQTIHTAINSGTLGYMPPEFLRGIITPMSDIFALGVIIMEVITGHRDYPYDIRASSNKFIELELQKWRNVLQKEPGYTSLEIDCQQITRCIQIGLICVNPVRTKRPTMKKIIDMLQGLESMDWYISNELSNPNIQAEAP